MALMKLRLDFLFADLSQHFRMNLVVFALNFFFFLYNNDDNILQTNN